MSAICCTGCRQRCFGRALVEVRSSPFLNVKDSYVATGSSLNMSAGSCTFPQPTGNYFQKQVDQTEDDTAKECRKKTLDAETRYENGGELQHERINDEPENAEADQGERKRYNFQKQTNGRIDQSDHDGGK